MTNTTETQASTLQAARARLADLRAEYAARQADHDANRARVDNLVDRIAVLTAETHLDGVDHSARIVKAQQEIAQLESALDAWPAVQQELGRRIAQAEHDHAAALELDRQQQLAKLAEREAKLRQEWSTAAATLLEIGAMIGDIHQQRTAMRSQMTDEYTSGQRPNMNGTPVNPPLPAFPAGALFNRQHLAEALRGVRTA